MQFLKGNVTEQSRQIFPHLGILHSRWPLMTTEVELQLLPIPEHSIRDEATVGRALSPLDPGAGS